MTHLDLHKLALRLKVVEMLRIYVAQRGMAESVALWRRLMDPN